MQFYKGYLITKEKVSNEPRTGRTNFPSLEDVKDYPEYAGVLADSIVLVDFDDPEQAAAALSIVQDLQIPCRAIKTTRGIHILFHSPDRLPERTHCKTACGLEADYKIGFNNSYEVLKYKGQEREILLDTGCGELPFFFYQLPGSKIDLWGMKEGEGRNDALFRYEIDCMKIGLDKDQIRNLFQIINNYVLADPVSDEELNSITRDEAFRNILARDKSPNLKDVSDFMIAREYIVQNHDHVFIYLPEGRYSDNRKYIEQRTRKYIPNSSMKQRNEVLANLALDAPEKSFSDKRYISFRNGVYDLNTDLLEPHTPSYMIPNQIPWNYDPNAYGEQIENVIWDWTCGDKEVFDLIEEVIGYCLYRENTFRKFFFIIGNKRNGKTKFLQLLANLIGEENVSYVSLEDIDERFHTVGLFGKLVNIGDDIEDKGIERTSVLKKVTTGQKVEVEKKGKDPFNLDPYATLIFSANKIPHIKDETKAVRDRMTIIPFNAHFEEGSEKDKPNILDDLVNDVNMSFLINLGINGLCRILERGRFTKPRCVQDAMQKYMLEVDPLTAFIDENKTGIIGKPTAEVYVSYEHYCREHNVDYRILTHTKFTQRVKTAMNCETGVVNGKNTFKL